MPDTLRLVAGTSYRFRVINIAPDWRVVVTLGDSGSPVQWRDIARGGADLPLRQDTERPAYLLMGPGETTDFNFTPQHPGVLALEGATQLKGWALQVPITVMGTFR